MSPEWTSVLPPLVAIGLAVLFRQVLVALSAGVFLGACLVADGRIGEAVVRFFDTYIVGALADADHASIIVFSLLLGGMIGVITKSGGGAELATVVTRRATTSRRGGVVTWAMGLVVFFDDYANALIVGSSMRSISDRLRISREKLAFIVDATAAPVSSVALVSSWIAVEVGYIADQFQSLGIEDDAYIAFIKSLPYRFYPWLMLFFVLWVAMSGRDFGPMAKVERAARSGAQPQRSEAPPSEQVRGHWIHAVIPIFSLIVIATTVMVYDGWLKVVDAGNEPTLRAVFGAASSTKALLISAGAGSLLAVLSAWVGRVMSFSNLTDAWGDGVKSMMTACMILVLAWALGDICKALQTAEFLTQSIEGMLQPALVPAVVFVLSAVVSFATGTSWGTMAILFPLVVPLAHGLAPNDMVILLGSISAILSGSVWGDHCSPISDTTILSSMATGCDHVAHVRTQLPYAMAVGLVSLVVGEIGVGLGLYPVWVGLVVGAVLLVVILRVLGQRVPDYAPNG